MRYLIMLVMPQSCFGSAVSQPVSIDSQTFGKVVYEATASFPPQEGYLKIEWAGGMTGLSAWRWYVIEAGAKAPEEIIKTYFLLINQKLKKSGILTSGSPQTKGAFGLRAFALKSADGNTTGTISIAVRSLSATRFAIVVSSAVSSHKNAK